MKDYTNDLISIIIPVYNVEDYVGSCIESVLKQTYQNMEVILIDDGSTDSGGFICDSYAEQDRRIRVIHQENKGLSCARNTGLQMMRGDYVFFLDSDDCIASGDVIMQLYRKISDTDADVVMGGYSMVNPEGKEIRRESLPQRSLDRNSFWDFYMEKSYVSCIYVWTKLYKSALFQEVWFPAGKYYEDEWVIDPIVQRCVRIETVDCNVIRYLSRDNSVVNSGMSIRRLHYSEGILERIERFIEEENYQYLKEWFLKGTIDIIRGYVELDYHINPETREYINLLQKRYAVCGRRITKKTKADGDWVKIKLWNLGLPLYRIVRNWFSSYKI